VPDLSLILGQSAPGVPTVPAAAETPNVAPGSIVVVRDAEWLVTSTEMTTSGLLVRVQGLSELVRDTTATFYSGIDQIVPLDPAAAIVVADASSNYSTAKLWLEAALRKAPVPMSAPNLTASTGVLVDALDYQRAAVRKALDPANLRPRILLADAVGLGKTVEIGMILAELVRRGRGESILIVTPRHVLEQMQHEMWSRFALPFVRLDSVGIQRVRQKLPATRNPFSMYKRAIISIDTLKQEKYRRYLSKHRWDAVVIDESHNITGATQNNRLARMLAANAEALILASATPHNGKKESFAELIRLLEPTAVTPSGEVIESEAKNLIIRRHRHSPEVAREVGSDWAERKKVQHKLLAASPAENAVAKEISQTWLHPEGASPYSGANSTLFPWTLAKGFLSSTPALIESLDARSKSLDRANPSHKRELEALAHLRELAITARDSSSAKYEGLKAYLKQIGVSAKSDERVVIFSERVPTLKWLTESLKRDLKLKDEQIAVLHGGLTDVEQQEVVESFKQAASPIRVLVTGDVASEGVNLHSQCHELVHYDIPWSLIRIEQRNGRIDRYGQRHAPQITTLLLEVDDDKFSGDVRVLKRLVDRESEAHTALGDVASLMDKYSAAEEEDEIRKVLAGERDFDDVVKTPEEVLSNSGSIAAFLAGVGAQMAEKAIETSDDTKIADDDDDAPPAPAEGESTGLFTDDIAFLRAALHLAFETPAASVDLGGVEWREFTPESIVQLRPPRDLEQRLEVLPQTYLREREVTSTFKLATTRTRANQLLTDARNDTRSTSSWPEAHYVGPLHPVLDWAADRALGGLGRNEVPAIRGAVDEPVVLLLATLSNRRGQVVARSFITAEHPDVGSPSFVIPTAYGSAAEALADLGVTATRANPGPVDASVLQSLIPAAVAAGLALGEQLSEASREAIDARIDHWSSRVEHWQRDADALNQIAGLRERRVTVLEEKTLAEQMRPHQTLVRPLLVVVPADTPVAHTTTEGA
jgi:ERCC4-related helicase